MCLKGIFKAWRVTFFFLQYVYKNLRVFVLGLSSLICKDCCLVNLDDFLTLTEPRRIFYMSYHTTKEKCHKLSITRIITNQVSIDGPPQSVTDRLQFCWQVNIHPRALKRATCTSFFAVVNTYTPELLRADSIDSGLISSLKLHIHKSPLLCWRAST